VVKQSPAIEICRTCPQDRDAILSILEKTNFFRSHELLIAEEVLNDALAKDHEGDYQSFVAKQGQNTIGWICFGLTPCTVGTFDIYWVAVEPEKQRCGVGLLLMQFATNIIENQKGRKIVVDTSGSPRYESTRRFYEKMGYHAEARLRDFYDLGDDKVIYVRDI